MKMVLWIAVLLLPSLILATTDWQYQIYVSSSHGTNSSSCWTRSVYEPCGTLSLALQGVQHNSTVIYLYPGIYTLDHEAQQVRNILHVAIIGLSDDVTISCQPLVIVQLWLDDIIFQCIKFKNCSTGLKNSLPCPYNKCFRELDVWLYNNTDNAICVDDCAFHPGDEISFTVHFYDSCNGREYVVTNNVTVSIVSGPESVKLCSTSCKYTNHGQHQHSSCSFSLCYYYSNVDDSSNPIVIEFKTLNVSTNKSLSIIFDCGSNRSMDLSYNMQQYIILNTTTGKCEHICDIGGIFGICFSHISVPLCYFEPVYTDTCAPGRTGRLCGSCKDGYSVPINILLLDKCVQCNENWIWLVFFQLLPVSVMVLLIIVLNLQLTNGSINALVFYGQLLTAIYPGLTFNGIFIPPCIFPSFYDKSLLHTYLYLIPLNILNLDFTLFFYNYPLCISSATTPLGALSFQYVIGLYPLVLLLLLYVWITLYNKGYKIIVPITRPIHRLLARFWHMTNIEPSLPHSIASIYVLCYMKLTATSFKMLHRNDKGGFFYDGTLNYFGWPHSFAGIFAILVLILLVLLPTLYIQFYPSKLFHKLLEHLQLDKLQMLKSLGDVFTGPYKNSKLDCRYFAAFYFLLRIIILLLYFLPNNPGIVITQGCLFVLTFGVIMIFHPYRKELNNFSEFFIFLLLAATSVLSGVYYNKGQYAWTGIVISFDFILGLIIFGYLVYWTVKKTKSGCGYKVCKPQRSECEIQEVDINDRDWIADCMENPQNYYEQHFPVAYQPYDENNDY